ncbi:MAG: DUF1223 domain-containing protein [Burkholderiales bacterium]
MTAITGGPFEEQPMSIRSSTARLTAAVLWLCAQGLAGTAMAAQGSGPAATCSAQSGPTRATLVELYTSEGCSSCPSADAALSRLSKQRAAVGTSPIVPLALHVPYWDAIGWKDPYAQPVFETRQRRLAAANGQRSVYTPHYFINGREALDWRRELSPALQRANGQPPGAALGLQVAQSPTTAGTLTVQVTVQPAAARPHASGAWELVLALTESGLVSQVSAGENGGVTLHHEHVVRRWFAVPTGPAGPASSAQVGTQQAFQIPLDPRWRPDRLSLTAFVQNTASGEMLQALALPLCPALVTR